MTIPFRGMTSLSIAGFALAALAVISALSAGLGNRLGVMDLRIGFTVLRWSVYLGLAALALALVGLWRSRPWSGQQGPMFALLALVLGALVVGVPLNQLRIARSVPPINDITTDPEDPPAFSAILPLRAGSPVPSEYGGAEVASQQRKAYPDIVPLRLPGAPEAVFPRVLNAARGLGWEIVLSDPPAGRIEAVDTTFFFGFKDDIVVRLRAEGGETRVDVRSHSRVGKSDIGKNARRIRAFLERARTAT